MDRESCVLERVFLLTDNQTYYDSSATNAGFSDLMKWSLMSHFKSLIWMRDWHENHSTEQGKPCQSTGVRAQCRAKPSLFEVRSGRSTLQAFLSQCALVKGPDNTQKDARVGCRQIQMLKNIAQWANRRRRRCSDVLAKYAESAPSSYDMGESQICLVSTEEKCHQSWWCSLRWLSHQNFPCT